MADPGGSFGSETPLRPDPGVVAENARTGCIRVVHVKCKFRFMYITLMSGDEVPHTYVFEHADCRHINKVTLARMCYR